MDNLVEVPCICGWCGEELGVLEIPSFEMERMEGMKSHGICKSCYEELTAELNFV